MKKLCMILAMVFFSTPAFAFKTANVDITTINAIPPVLTVKKHGGDVVMYEGTLSISGTFNGCTVHWLVSPDGGTTKFAETDRSRVAVTSTAAEMLPLEYGVPSAATGIILYASVAGCTSAPDLDVTIYDNRQ